LSSLPGNPDKKAKGKNPGISKICWARDLGWRKISSHFPSGNLLITGYFHLEKGIKWLDGLSARQLFANFSACFFNLQNPSLDRYG
jgi:hypothetical protein